MIARRRAGRAHREGAGRGREHLAPRAAPNPGEEALAGRPGSFAARPGARLAAAILLLGLGGAARGWEPSAEMPAIRVTPAESALTIGGLARAEEEAEQSIGNVSVVPAEAYRSDPVISLHDALAGSPGVYAPSPAGQQSVRLSIRGSGLSTAFSMRGVRLLRDGMQLSRADGFADTTWLDPLSAEAIEVYRGANAMSLGVSTLGGAINAISPTAYSWRGREVRVEAGGDGYRHWQARAAGRGERGLDAYVAVSEFRTDGARDHAEQIVRRFYANAGYRFGPTAESRLHLGVEQNRQQFPGPLSLEQMRQDPRQASARAVRADEALELWPRWNLAYQHVWQPAAAHRVLLGAYTGQTTFINPNANLELSYRARDHGVSVRHEWEGQLGDRPVGWLWGANLAWSRSANQTHGPVWLADVLLDPRPVLFEEIQSKIWTHELYAEGRWRLRPGLTLVGGLLATWARRGVDLDVVNQTSLMSLFREVEQAERYFGLSPRLGAVWQAAPRVQFFANLSRSFEPPTSAEFVSVSGILQAQRATTAEVGSRGGDSRFGWEVAGYHSRVGSELLGIEFPPNSGRFVAANIDRTRRFGLEAKWHGIWRMPGRMGRLTWDLAYTWSRGTIVESDGFNGKVLPGIPVHYGRLALRYLHPDGWYGGPDWELASGWYVDQANTLRAPGHGVWHLTGGYASPDGRRRWFISLRNVADKTYVANTSYLVAAAPGAEAYYPGQGRTWIAGLQWHW